MNARTSSLIGLSFGALWLWLGAMALPMPWRLLAGAVGVVAFLLIAFRVWRRPVSNGQGFNRGRFRIAVLLEFAALAIAGWILGRLGLNGYLWPVIGIIVGLHFIGLWWASHDRRFLGLTAGMTAINLFALTLASGSSTMLAVSGLGSAAAIGWAIAA